MPARDVRDELRAIAAERHKRGTPQVKESIGQIAERLTVMFPSVPQETVQAVLSQLFRADAQCSREQLADRAVCALLEMSFGEGLPQTVTSFEPVTLTVDGEAFEDLAPSAPPPEVLDLESQMASGRSKFDSSGGSCVQDVDDLSEIARESLDVPSKGNHSENLDVMIAELFLLPEDARAACFRTLCKIVDRIAAEPSNARVRRLRFGNASFRSAVGKHNQAVALLVHAGFWEDSGEGDDDRALVFDGDVTSSEFVRVQKYLRSLAEDYGLSDPSVGTTITPVVGVPVDPEEASRRRQLIAKLTEERLRNPTRFREEARARGVGVRGGGQVHVRQPPRRPSNEPYRRAQHFTLADIDRARISDDIANMPNYADQYRLDRQGQSAHDYSTLVSRMYDPELIAREALDGTNQYRASQGLAPLRWHGDVARIAAEHAGQMASGTAPFSHDGVNQRVNRYPMPHRGAAENLALTSGDSRVAKVAVDGWIKSPGHEKNLRGPFNTCGIGVARSATGTFYLTQLFAHAS